MRGSGYRFIYNKQKDLFMYQAVEFECTACSAEIGVGEGWGCVLAGGLCCGQGRLAGWIEGTEVAQSCFRAWIWPLIYL